MNFLKWSGLLLLLSICTSLSAEIKGKVDAAPAYVHIDVLESGHTIKTMNMIAFKGDATIVVWKGLCLKPTVLVGNGNGNLFSGGGGIGFVWPVNEWFCVTPSAGYLYTQVHTTLKIVHPVAGPLKLKEKFRSISPYISMETTFTFRKKWRLCLQYQYSWSSTRTKLTGIPESKSHAAGANYAAMIEYDVTDCWSVQIGGAYNISLTKEKHGLRGAGGKLGVAYWF